LILIKNARYVIKNADSVLENADVRIEGERITEIGSHLDAPADAEVIDASGKIVSPGFANTHTHLYQNMLKGCRDDLLLKEWCEEVTFPFVNVIFRYSMRGDDELAYSYGLLGAVEQLRSGITAFVDFDMIFDRMIEAWEDVGIRGTAGIQTVNKWIPKELMVSDEENHRNILNTVKKWHNKGLIKVAMAPSTPFTCTPDYLTWIRDTACECGMKTFCHVSENKWEIEQSLRDVGMTPLAYLDSIGFLERPFNAVHGVCFTEDEIRLAADKGVGVCYNPKSNLKLASGIAPVTDLIKSGVRVALATDGAASNDLLDMFEEMRTGLLLQKVRYGDPACFDAHDIFRMATESGYDMLDIDAGRIEEGKLADLIILDTGKAHFGPVHDVIQNVVYCGKENDVETVIVNGRVVMRVGVITSIIYKEYVEKAILLCVERSRETEGDVMKADEP